MADPHPPPPVRSTKQRAPKPPTPHPPVAAAVSATQASLSISPNPAPPVSVSSSVAGWERSQSTLPSVSNTLDEMYSSSSLSKPSHKPTSVEKEKRVEDDSQTSPTFAQVSLETELARQALLWILSNAEFMDLKPKSVNQCVARNVPPLKSTCLFIIIYKA